MPPRPSPASPALVLVPTAGELDQLLALGGLAPEDARCELCGLGPVAAAARTAELLARLRPARVLLLGIAGSFDLERAPLGSAACFGEVFLDGVGAGQGPRFRSASQLGFPQWAGPPPIAERLTLAGPDAHVLLTVCAASADEAERGERRARHPAALAEDMEGFGAALACALAGVPLTVVRGFSNAVGTRDQSRWQVRGALAAARALALGRLAGAGRDGAP